tara:strand:- start:171234 stop:172190 length:957 start_codon:yes stop_codon:yes gene_type:complete
MISFSVLAISFCFPARADSTTTLSQSEAQQFAKTFSPMGSAESEFLNVRVIRDIEYARYGDTVLLLDMYLPAESDQKIACVVTITGGGFRARPKSGFAKYAAFLATQGFASACISYRGTPKHGFQETVYDCKAAVRYVRANAAMYNIDPDRIGVLGQSAGGHLAAMIGVSGGIDHLEGDGGNPESSSRVQAAVSFSGVFDFISRLRDGGHQKKSIELKKKTNGAWVGEPFAVDSERWKQASPINHLSDDDPPLLMLATKTDSVVPYHQSVQMHEAMQKKGLTSELVILDTGGHGIASAPAIGDQVWHATLAFLRKHLR